MDPAVIITKRGIPCRVLRFSRLVHIENEIVFFSDLDRVHLVVAWSSGVAWGCKRGRGPGRHGSGGGGES